LIAGKSGGSTYDKKIHIFDTETNTIQTLSDTLPVVACYGLASATVGTSIYLFGGAGNSYYNHIIEFDTVTNTVTKLSAQLPVSLYYATAVAFETKVYVFGGKGSSTYNSIYVFDTEKQTISTLDVTLPTATYSIMGALFGTKIYLFGGYGVKTINVFDTETQTIETLESPTFVDVIYDSGIATIGDYAYIFGGYENSVGYSTTIRKFSVVAHLESSTMAINYTTGKGNVFIINSDALTIAANVKSAYVGDESGIAQRVEAFIYKDDAWTAI
jgi:N-acetylneuraminic acid mutarotase